MDIKTCWKDQDLCKFYSQSLNAATVGIAIAQFKTFNTFDQTTSFYIYVAFTQIGDVGNETYPRVTCTLLTVN